MTTHAGRNRNEPPSSELAISLSRLLESAAQAAGARLSLSSVLVGAPLVSGTCTVCGAAPCHWLGFGAAGEARPCPDAARSELSLERDGITFGLLRGCCPSPRRARGLGNWMAAVADITTTVLATAEEADASARELIAAYEELSLVYDLSELIVEPPGERELAAQVLARVHEVVRCDAAALLASAEGGHLRVLSHIGLPSDAPRAVASATERFCTDGALAALAGTGILLAPKEVGLDWAHGEALLCALAVRREPHGILLLARSRGPRFRSGEVKLAQAAARQAGLAIANTALQGRLARLFVSTVRALAAAVDAKDPSTRGHSERVAAMAVRVGRALSLPHDQLEQLQLAALLHDIGKIGVSTEVLSKPGPLSRDEWPQIKSHPVRGAEILACVPELAPIVAAVKYHHERMDGSGYPEGLRGDAIPLLARIVAVCDAYDAMTSVRPYRPAIPAPEAIAILRDEAGRLYDPVVVEALVDVCSHQGLQDARRKQAA